jgi:hypothetical protein
MSRVLVAVVVVLSGVSAAAAERAGQGGEPLGGNSQQWKRQVRTLVAPRPQPRAAVPQAAAVHAQAGPTYPGSPYTIEGLIAQRDLNPARFDRNHPHIGALLAQDERMRAALAAGLPVTGGLLPDTPLNRYLKFRRSLNPARFDTYHPILGPILGEDDRLRTLPRPSPQELLPPPIGSVAGPSPFQPAPEGSGAVGGTNDHGGPAPNPNPNPIPEPPAVSLLLLGAAAAAIPRLARRRRAPAPD